MQSSTEGGVAGAWTAPAKTYSVWPPKIPFLLVGDVPVTSLTESPVAGFLPIVSFGGRAMRTDSGVRRLSSVAASAWKVQVRNLVKWPVGT